jgi:kynurenine formamidase
VSDTEQEAPLPTADEVLGYFEQLSNWGRWGADDARGTLNFVTPEITLAAAQEIKTGRSVSCAWDIVARQQEGDLFGTPQRYMLNHGQGLADADRVTPPHRRADDRGFGASEFFGLVFHGLNVSHIDALSHIFWDQKMYNGYPAELVTSQLGATRLAITDIKDGISTRGVLLDVARAKGVDWLDPGTPVTPADLELAEQAQGVRVQSGDAVFLRTGYGKYRQEHGPGKTTRGQPGWHASALPWIHQREVAVIGCDTGQDVTPSGYYEAGLSLPVHSIGISAMGLWLIDNLDLEAVAEASIELSRWSFFLSLQPLRIEGGTGSPLNPVALF